MHSPIFDSSDGSRWTLFGSDNAVRGANYLTNHPDNTDFSVSLPYGGEQLLVLSGANAGGPVNYGFRVTDVGATPTPLTIGSVVTNTITPGGGYTVYSFTGTPASACTTTRCSRIRTRSTRRY